MTNEVTLRNFCAKQAGKEIGEAMVDIIQRNRDMFRSCLSCVSFNEPYSYCHKYQGNPPPRTIVYGCAGYYDRDEIPF